MKDFQNLSNEPGCPGRLSGEHVIISVNPKAGAGCSRRGAQRLAEILTGQGLKVRIETDLARIGLESCRLAEEGKLRALVGVGGDGTASELANRITAEVPLVMLAGGTENLLVRHIGWPREPEGLAEVIVAGQKTRMDLGQAGGRRFLMMLSCGIDAEVVRHLAEGRSGHISHTSYLGPIFKAVWHYQYPKIEVSCDDLQESGDQKSEDRPVPTPDKRAGVRWVVVTNTPLYAGGVKFSPDADISDGLLDICEFRRAGFLRSLGFYAAAKLGKCQRLKDCTSYRATRIRLTCDEPLPYQIDGDPGGMLPVEIELLPQAMTLLVPSGSLKFEEG